MPFIPHTEHGMSNRELLGRVYQIRLVLFFLFRHKICLYINRKVLMNVNVTLIPLTLTVFKPNTLLAYRLTLMSIALCSFL